MKSMYNTVYIEKAVPFSLIAGSMNKAGTLGQDHLQRSEICISGMATSSRHSLPRQPNSREEKKA
jgi:hypothetical protein